MHGYTNGCGKMAEFHRDPSETGCEHPCVSALLSDPHHSTKLYFVHHARLLMKLVGCLELQAIKVESKKEMSKILELVSDTLIKCKDEELMMAASAALQVRISPQMAQAPRSAASRHRVLKCVSFESSSVPRSCMLQECSHNISFLIGRNSPGTCTRSNRCSFPSSPSWLRLWQGISLPQVCLSSRQASEHHAEG
jgi:hypothetical protein